jgi:hypothetical protein
MRGNPGRMLPRLIAKFGLPQMVLKLSARVEKSSRFTEFFEPHQPASGCYEP